MEQTKQTSVEWLVYIDESDVEDNIIVRYV